MCKNKIEGMRPDFRDLLSKYMDMIVDFVSENNLSLNDFSAMHMGTFKYIVSGYMKNHGTLDVVCISLLKEFIDTILENKKR